MAQGAPEEGEAVKHRKSRPTPRTKIERKVAAAVRSTHAAEPIRNTAEGAARLSKAIADALRGKPAD